MDLCILVFIKVVALDLGFHMPKNQPLLASVALVMVKLMGKGQIWTKPPFWLLSRI